MQKKVLLTVIILFVTAWAVAQQGSNSQVPSTSSSQASSTSSSQAPSTSSNSQVPSTSSASQTSSQQESAVEGCLSGSAGNYTVTDKTGTSYKLQLPDDSHNSILDKHAGEQVRVRGVIAKADSSTAPGAGESKEAAAAGSMKSATTIKPSSLEKIADKCSTSPAASPDKK